MREAAWRVLGMRHYRVQIIGGIVLHQGRIAEMKTGEVGGLAHVDQLGALVIDQGHGLLRREFGAVAAGVQHRNEKTGGRDEDHQYENDVVEKKLRHFKTKEGAGNRKIIECAKHRPMRPNPPSSSCLSL